MNKTKYKSKIKKAVNGLDDVAVPEAGSGANVANATAQGASAGASFGPYGAIIGAGVGFAGGMYQKEDQDIANKKALQTNAYNKMNRGYSALDSTINQKYQVMKKGGKANTKMIEIEGKKTPEIHTDKDFNVKNLGTIPHTKGGNKVEASEGDIVFNTQNSPTKYKKISKAIQTGDKQTLIKEKNKLPDDDSNSKNQEGNNGMTTTKGARPYKKLTAPKEPTRKSNYKKLEDKGIEMMNRPNYINSSNYNKSPNVLNPGLSSFLNTNRSNTGVFNKLVDSGNKLIPDGNNTYVQDKNGAKYYSNGTAKGATSNSPVNKPLVNSILANKPTTYDKLPAKLPVGLKGKRISGDNTPIIQPNPVVPKFKPSNSSVGDGSDLKGQYLPNQYAGPNKPVDGIYNPSQPLSKTNTGTTPTNASQSNTAANIAQFAGVANNLFQGLKTEKPINQTYFDPEQLKYTDRSQSLRNQSTQQNNIDNSNARNLSGGNVGNLRANMQGANIANRTRQDAINEQEISRADGIDAGNTQLRNQAKQYNLQRKDMYQSQIDGQKAAKQAYVDQAASDIGKFGQLRVQQDYMEKRDDKMMANDLKGLQIQNAVSPFKWNADGTYKYESDSDNATSNKYSAASLFPLPQTNTRMRRKPGILQERGNNGIKVNKYNKSKYIKSK